MRKVCFINNEYYHIHNRGVDKREIFGEEGDYLRFLLAMREFNNVRPVGSLYELNYQKSKGAKEAKLPIGSLASELVNVICYCLSPNHFHLILEQLKERGIEKFMHKLGTGYTKYFNQKYNRSGSLFQGSFQSIHINTNEYLLWLSGYVNGNIEIHNIAEVGNYKWCSYQDYVEQRGGNLCNRKKIISQFSGTREYGTYVSMVIKESGGRKDLKKYFIEEC